VLLSWEVDFRSGGAARMRIRSPDGAERWVDGVRLEIAEPERIVFTGTLPTWSGNRGLVAGTVTFRRKEGGAE
jgi:uncharacterized protein YndB with AHSA1/START domain